MPTRLAGHSRGRHWISAWVPGAATTQSRIRAAIGARPPSSPVGDAAGLRQARPIAVSGMCRHGVGNRVDAGRQVDPGLAAHREAGACSGEIAAVIEDRVAGRSACRVSSSQPASVLSRAHDLRRHPALAAAHIGGGRRLSAAPSIARSGIRSPGSGRLIGWLDRDAEPRGVDAAGPQGGGRAGARRAVARRQRRSAAAVVACVAAGSWAAWLLLALLAASLPAQRSLRRACPRCRRWRSKLRPRRQAAQAVAMIVGRDHRRARRGRRVARRDREPGREFLRRRRRAGSSGWRSAACRAAWSTRRSTPPTA